MLWDSDWSSVSLHSIDPERTAAVLAAWDDHLVHPALPRTLGPSMREAGFVDVVPTGHAFWATDLLPGTMAQAMVGFIRDFAAIHPTVGPEPATSWFQEMEDLHAAGRFFFAYLQFAFTGVSP